MHIVLGTLNTAVLMTSSLTMALAVRSSQKANRSLRLWLGLNEPVGTLVNVAWVAFDLVVLSVLVTAARYQGFEPGKRSADAVHD